MSINKTINSLSAKTLNEKLRGSGLVILIGPFVFCIKSPLPSIATNVHRLYGDFQLLSDNDLVDFYVTIKKPLGIRRYLKPQINFYCDDHSPFLPLPVNQAFALLEWGMNWCIAQHAHRYLLLHSAVLEKNGKTVILPAQSGSGKSTLCALLAQSGWRLLSDEMALIDNVSYQIQALARPISLKNESIDIIQTFSPDAIMGQVVDDTNKGTISHLKPSTESVKQLNQQTAPFAIVFPVYEKNSKIIENKVDKADAFMKIIQNSFNYGLLGEVGFNTVEQLIDNSHCHALKYSQTDDALNFFDRLVN